MKIATIDIGTNSTLLLIANSQDNNLSPIHETSTVTRLGQGVDKTQQIHPDAITRNINCLKDFAARIKQHNATLIDVVSTSAARDASGIREFLDAAEQVLGKKPRVISGIQEATLSFWGALYGLNINGPVAIFDLGGGSTEIVYGTIGNTPKPTINHAKSIDIGCVRLTERHILKDPPSSNELLELQNAIDNALSKLDTPPDDHTWIGIGGSVTTLVAIKKGITAFDPALIHGQELSGQDVASIVEKLQGLTIDERNRVPGMEPLRSDVIIAGGCIVRSLLTWTGKGKSLVSSRGVQWGLAAAYQTGEVI
ncbi:MAG: Ppx/GppA family phosphatase [Polyangiaceae bacterium]|nr:Ppx/GppA family phosphatase [Polyangiaceae bacterium]